jgi:hypothetical protein
VDVTIWKRLVVLFIVITTMAVNKVVLLLLSTPFQRRMLMKMMMQMIQELVVVFSVDCGKWIDHPQRFPRVSAPVVKISVVVVMMVHEHCPGFLLL